MSYNNVRLNNFRRDVVAGCRDVDGQHDFHAARQHGCIAAVPHGLKFPCWLLIGVSDAGSWNVAVLHCAPFQLPASDTPVENSRLR